jgi:hypothetical protein
MASSLLRLHPRVPVLPEREKHMTRVSLLLPLAALAAGCYSSNPCYAPFLNVYWTPGAAPNGGFQVPGLVAAGFPQQLGCTDAGVDSVQVFVGGIIVPCTGGGGFCVDSSTWLCSTGGVSVPLDIGGTYDVQVDAYDANANLKYSSGVVLAGASDCGDSAVGVFPQGRPGTLDIDYAFVPPANCQAGSTIDWDLRSGLSAPFDTGSIACGTTNPFRVNGGVSLPAGVYTLDSIAEVAGGTSIHAFCGAPFPHAGPETLIVDMPFSTATCF